VDRAAVKARQERWMRIAAKVSAAVRVTFFSAVNCSRNVRLQKSETKKDIMEGKVL
jgi:hypothetical protein